MGFQAKNINDILSLWPDSVTIHYESNEIKTACPFCPDDGASESVIDNGHSFVGVDRFIISHTGAFCRRCFAERQVRHYTFSQIADRLSIELSEDFSYGRPEKKQTELSVLTDTQVFISHMSVDRNFWKKFGWTDSTIDKFNLGLHEILWGYGAAHIIPMEVLNTQDDTTRKWFAEGRYPDGEKRRMRGTSSHYVWLIHEDKTNPSVYIAEGVKDAISLYQMGVRNIVGVLGSTIWNSDKTNALRRKGFTNFIACGDNDDAGISFNKTIGECARMSGATSQKIVWEGKPKKYDITNLLQDEKDNAFSVLSSYLKDNTIYSVQIRVSADDLEPKPYSGDRKTYEYVPLDEIRGTGVRSLVRNIHEFVYNYRQTTTRGRGKLLLLNASPGTGKTHTLVKTVEPIAKDRRKKVDDAHDQFLTAIAEMRQQYDESTSIEERESLKDMIENYTKRMNDLSRTSVLWVAKFKNSSQDLMDMANEPDIWFDFDRRNPENCDNYYLTLELGSKNHDIRSYCESVCPFADKCKKSGYLSQETKMKEKSITIVRHQHLVNQSMIDLHRDLVVVDESPLETIESPLVVRSETLDPFTDLWYLEIDNDPESPIVKSATLLVKAIKDTIRSTDTEIGYYGASFFGKLDSIIRFESNDQFDLSSVMKNIDDDLFPKYYQPTFIASGASEIFIRTMPFVFPVLVEEYVWYEADKNHKRPSRIHTYFNKKTGYSVLEIRQMKTPKIRSTTPIIVADATTDSAELYNIAFNRPVEVYAPETQNPNLVEHVLYGKDFTTTYRNKAFGKLIKDKISLVDRSVKNVLGEEVSLDSIEMTDSTYEDIPKIDEYFDIILYVAARHAPCLIISHMDVQNLLEPVFRKRYPTLQESVSWGHYWSLRGKNTYKDHNSAVLFGVPREPYNNLWRRVQAWAAMAGREEEIPYDFMLKEAPYGNHEKGNKHRTFTNQFAQWFVDMSEKGEIQQCAERIRPHVSDLPKHIYYVMNRPMDAKNIQDVQHIRSFLSSVRQEQQSEEVINFMCNQFYITGKLPAVNETRRIFGLQYSVVKDLQDIALKKVGVRLG